jgi:hypothetical protein
MELLGLKVRWPPETRPSSAKGGFVDIVDFSMCFDNCTDVLVRSGKFSEASEPIDRLLVRRISLTI